MKTKIFDLVREFSSGSHGASNYDKEDVFIMGEDEGFVPLSYLAKKIPEVKSIQDLQSLGFMYSSYLYMDSSNFSGWFQKQFSKKLPAKLAKDVGILYYPDKKEIFDAVEVVDKAYKSLKKYHVLMNGKNLPIQLGEWYAKSIFGLMQIKSSSQRGFDFYDHQKSRVEVKVHWNDASSPKGVKIKKSLLELSSHVIIMYISRNFMIRDILYLDSEFILRRKMGRKYVLNRARSGL